MPGNRSLEQIVAEMLKIAAEPCLQNSLMRRANLGYNQFKFYLALLLEKKLLKVEGDKFVITDKGREYVKTYFIITEIMESPSQTI